MGLVYNITQGSHAEFAATCSLLNPDLYVPLSSSGMMQSRSPYYSHPSLLVSRDQTFSNSHPMMDDSKFSRGPESISLWRYHLRSEESRFTVLPGRAYLDVQSSTVIDISPSTDHPLLSLPLHQIQPSCPLSQFTYISALYIWGE